MKRILMSAILFCSICVCAFPRTVSVNPVYLSDNICASFGTRSVNSKTYKSVFVYQDKLWLCAEKIGEYNSASTNVWKRTSFYTILNSEDGTNWNIVGKNIQIGNRPYLITDDKLYTYNGRYSQDAINWKGDVFKPRGVEISDYALSYFDKKIWLIGGLVNSNPLSVVWSTKDGVNWSRIPVPWKGRVFGINDVNIFVYSRSMRLYGGINEFNRSFMEDSWRTTDGIKWQQTEYIGKSSMDNLARSTRDNSDIFYRMQKEGNSTYLYISANGIDWIKNVIEKNMTESALWSSYAQNTLRGYNNIIYFKKSLWIFGFDFEVMASNYNRYLQKGDTNNWHPNWELPKSPVLVASLKYNVR